MKATRTQALQAAYEAGFRSGHWTGLSGLTLTEHLPYEDWLDNAVMSMHASGLTGLDVLTYDAISDFFHAL